MKLLRIFALLTLAAAPLLAQSGAPLTAVQAMQAARRHAQKHGGAYTPIFSPSAELLAALPPETTRELTSAGFPVVPWTVNKPEVMQQLFDAGVSGVISDRPDLLRELVVNNKDARGGLLFADGSLDVDRFNAAGHRGGRDLRPESTFPAFEAGLDNLVTTLETDMGVTSDGVVILSHERHVDATSCRDVSGAAYGEANRVFYKDITADALRARFVCDKLFRGPQQKNDLSLSPVSSAFVAARHLSSALVHPRLEELYDFVDFYVDYYTKGAGRAEPNASLRADNARRVRICPEIKIDPRPELWGETIPAQQFVDAVARVIERGHREARTDVQSFNFFSLAILQAQHPRIRTLYLFGDPRQLRPEAWPKEMLEQ